MRNNLFKKLLLRKEVVLLDINNKNHLKELVEFINNIKENNSKKLLPYLLTVIVFIINDMRNDNKMSKKTKENIAFINKYKSHFKEQGDFRINFFTLDFFINKFTLRSTIIVASVNKILLLEESNDEEAVFQKAVTIIDYINKLNGKELVDIRDKKFKTKKLKIGKIRRGL